MNKFFLFFLLAAALVLPAAKVHSATFSDLDHNRIVYAPQQKSKFLVVDKIDKDQDQLQCHVFGKSAKVTVSTYDVNKTPFYETTSTMVLSQYALYYRAGNLKNNYAMALWQMGSDKTGRLAVYNAFNAERIKTLQKLQQALQANKSISDPDDRLDNLHRVLDECILHEMINRSLESNDFVLIFTMYREFQAVMAQIIKHDREKTSLYTAVNELNADLEKEICEAFALHYEQIAERRKKFEKLFPKSRGNRWQKPLPNNKRELLYCFSDCMQSYFKLDKLSSITEPQEWASAMLDVLMLIGGAPCAQDLEKEFDEEIESLEKSIPEQ